MGEVDDDARRKDLAALGDRVRACTLCRLHEGRAHAVPGEGPLDPPVLLVGEAPGREEDASGRPFVGAAGRVLDKALRAAGLPRDAVFVTNVVKCRPPGNRAPKADEMEACRPYLLAQIELVRIALWAYTAVVLLLIPFMRRVLLTRPPGADERSAAARLSRCAVITNALAETPAVLGFVLVLLNGLYLDFYVLAAVSILLILLYFPRYEAWEEWVKQRP